MSSPAAILSVFLEAGVNFLKVFMKTSMGWDMTGIVSSIENGMPKCQLLCDVCASGKLSSSCQSKDQSPGGGDSRKEILPRGKWKDWWCSIGREEMRMYKEAGE